MSSRIQSKKPLTAFSVAVAVLRSAILVLCIILLVGVLAYATYLLSQKRICIAALSAGSSRHGFARSENVGFVLLAWTAYCVGG